MEYWPSQSEGPVPYVRFSAPIVPWILLLPLGCGGSLTAGQKEACKFDRACMDICAQAQQDESHRERCIAAMQEVGAPPDVPAPPPRRRAQRDAVATVTRSTDPLTPAAIASRSTQSIVVVKTDQGLGSGFAVAMPQRVVTNLHVVAGASKIQAFLVDGETLEVTGVLGWDTVNDLAVLQIAEGLPMLTLAKDPPNVGAPVVAIGNPLGFAATVSDGIVSAFRAEEATTLMQISAPIAPGSSGGPVIDDHGQVVGVAVATIRGGQNLNFAVPARYVAAVLQSKERMSIEDFGKATRAPAKAEEKEKEKEKDLPEAPSFKGCSEADKKYLASTLKEALDTGAALCATGKGAACFHVYEGGAQDAEKGVSNGCAGPRTALAAARTSAQTLNDAAEKAHLLARTMRSVAGAAGR